MIARKALTNPSGASSRQLGMDEALGKALLEGAFLTRDQLDNVKAAAAASGKSLKEVALEREIIAPEVLASVLAFLLELPVVELRHCTVQPAALAQVPGNVARRLSILPVSVEEDILRVVAEGPLDGEALQALRELTGMRVRLVLALTGGVRSAIDEHYGRVVVPEMDAERVTPVRESPRSPLGGLADAENAGCGAAGRLSEQGAGAPLPGDISQQLAPGAEGLGLAELGGATRGGGNVRAGLPAFFKRRRSDRPRLALDEGNGDAPRSTRRRWPWAWRKAAGATGQVLIHVDKPRGRAQAGASTQAAANRPQQRVGINPALQLAVWVVGILFFGFGDTLTSLMVFESSGREANFLLAALLRVVGPTVAWFLIIKVVATLAVVLVSRLRPRLEVFASLSMLCLGMFLVAQNSTILLLSR